MNEIKNNHIELIDFSKCQLSSKEYNTGSMPKYGVVYNNENYMLKEQVKEKTHYIKLGYSATYLSSVFSEYIASNMAKNIGLNVHKTLLGFVLNENNERTYVVACKDFLKDNESVFDFKKVALTTLDRKQKDFRENFTLRTKTLNGILSVMEQQKLVNQFDLKEHFWKMFVFDAYIGNFDRNATNWGLIKNNNVESGYYISPIFDNGSCLHPKTPKVLIKEYLKKAEQDESFLENASVFSLTSSINDFEQKRIYYVDFFKESENIDFLFAVKNLYPQIVKSHERNIEIIKSLSEILEKERMELLIKEMNYRLLHLLKPTYERSLSQKYSSQYLSLEIDKKLDLEKTMDNFMLKFNIKRK